MALYEFCLLLLLLCLYMFYTFLIWQRGIETILLFKSSSEARNVMADCPPRGTREVSVVAKFVQEVYTALGYITISCYIRHLFGWAFQDFFSCVVKLQP